MIEFFKLLIKFFDKNQIDYMLSGSVAMSAYTLPRSTRDFDFVVALHPKDISLVVNTFKKDYYCDEDAVKDAIQNESMFNIIDFASGFKADIVVLKNTEYRQTEFNRRQQIQFFDTPIYIVSVEDLILSKFIWIQDFQSPLQMEDIKHLLEIKELDQNYINHWIKRLNLHTFNIQKHE